jgi:hypothetical protein
MSRRKEPAISNELLDQLLGGGDAAAESGVGSVLWLSRLRRDLAAAARSCGSRADQSPTNH